MKPPAGKYILDVCCGSRMFYYDQQSPFVVYMDVRKGKYQLSDGRTIEVKPDVEGNFCMIPFDNESFSMVVFDPPHLLNCGENSDLCKKYGKLDRERWAPALLAGFTECFRVLKKHGILLFKWNESDIPLSRMFQLSPYYPLLGTRTTVKTAFVTFLKEKKYKK